MLQWGQTAHLAINLAQWLPTPMLRVGRSERPDEQSVPIEALTALTAYVCRDISLTHAVAVLHRLPDVYARR